MKIAGRRIGPGAEDAAAGVQAGAAAGVGVFDEFAAGRAAEGQRRLRRPDVEGGEKIVAGEGVGPELRGFFDPSPELAPALSGTAITLAVAAAAHGRRVPEPGARVASREPGAESPALPGRRATDWGRCGRGGNGQWLTAND